jgi:hypothetical protein
MSRVRHLFALGMICTRFQSALSSRILLALSNSARPCASIPFFLRSMDSRPQVYGSDFFQRLPVKGTTLQRRCPHDYRVIPTP